VLNSHSRSLSAQHLPGQLQQHQQGDVLHEAEVPLHLQQHERSGQQLSAHVDEPLSAKQQLQSTFRNKLIWYLMLLKALKVGCNSAASAAAGVLSFCSLFAVPCGMWHLVKLQAGTVECNSGNCCSLVCTTCLQLGEVCA
jgi:hypothetical protein